MIDEVDPKRNHPYTIVYLQEIAIFETVENGFIL